MIGLISSGCCQKPKNKESTASAHKLRIAMVTTLMPETHYARYLIEALDKTRGELRLHIYSNKEAEIAGLQEANIAQCWSQNSLYPFQIATQAVKDRMDIVHLQHEINMYGGPATAILFPILVLLLRLLRRKVIVTIHAIVPRKEIDSSFLETFSGVKSKLMVAIAKAALFYINSATCWLSHFVIVHSNGLKSTLVSDYRVREEKVVVIPHGVPVQDLSQRAEEVDPVWWNKIKDRKVILCFGYIVKRKGLEYLIDAFEQVSKTHPDYVLAIAGGSLPGHEDYVKRLKRSVREKGLLEQIVFTSFVKEAELQQLLAKSEFVVLPAIYSVSASGPLAQAISFHKPVIATELGVFREEISHGMDGLLCPARSAPALAKAMAQLIENRDLLHKMSQNMRTKGEKRSWVNIALETKKVYANLKLSDQRDR